MTQGKYKSLLLILFLYLLGAHLAQTSPAFASSANSFVAQVIDAETLLLSNGSTITLLGINAPKSYSFNRGPNLFANEATRFSKNEIEGKTVRLEKDSGSGNSAVEEAYYVYRDSDGFFLNGEMIKRGFVFISADGQFEKKEEFRSFEKIARDNGRGLWEEYCCTVLKIEGRAYLSSETMPVQPILAGGLIKKGQTLTVAAGGWVDIGYDSERKNITQISGDSQIQFASVNPVRLQVTRGDVYARLKKLPPNSTFQIQTPLGVGVVRGSEYRVTYGAGKMEVFNYAQSPVEVYGIDSTGQAQTKPVILSAYEATRVSLLGQRPERPYVLSREAISDRKGISQSLDERNDFIGPRRATRGVVDGTSLPASETQNEIISGAGSRSRPSVLRDTPLRTYEMNMTFDAVGLGKANKELYMVKVPAETSDDSKTWFYFKMIMIVGVSVIGLMALVQFFRMG